MSPTDIVLQIDLQNLSEEEYRWLHELRNLCQKIELSRQRRRLLEAYESGIH